MFGKDHHSKESKELIKELKEGKESKERHGPDSKQSKPLKKTRKRKSNDETKETKETKETDPLKPPLLKKTKLTKRIKRTKRTDEEKALQRKVALTMRKLKQVQAKGEKRKAASKNAIKSMDLSIQTSNFTLVVETLIDAATLIKVPDIKHIILNYLDVTSQHTLAFLNLENLFSFELESSMQTKRLYSLFESFLEDRCVDKINIKISKQSFWQDMNRLLPDLHFDVSNKNITPPNRFTKTIVRSGWAVGIKANFSCWSVFMKSRISNSKRRASSKRAKKDNSEKKIIKRSQKTAIAL